MSGQWVELGALWRRQDGKPGLVGRLNKKVRIYVRKNDGKREGSRDPDYYLLACADEPKPAPPQGAAAGGREPGDDGGLP